MTNRNSNVIDLRDDSGFNLKNNKLFRDENETINFSKQREAHDAPYRGCAVAERREEEKK